MSHCKQHLFLGLTLFLGPAIAGPFISTLAQAQVQASVLSQPVDLCRQEMKQIAAWKLPSPKSAQVTPAEAAILGKMGDGKNLQDATSPLDPKLKANYVKSTQDDMVTEEIDYGASLGKISKAIATYKNGQLVELFMGDRRDPTLPPEAPQQAGANLAERYVDLTFEYPNGKCEPLSFRGGIQDSGKHTITWYRPWASQKMCSSPAEKYYEDKWTMASRLHTSSQLPWVKKGTLTYAEPGPNFDSFAFPVPKGPEGDLERRDDQALMDCVLYTHKIMQKKAPDVAPLPGQMPPQTTAELLQRRCSVQEDQRIMCGAYGYKEALKSNGGIADEGRGEGSFSNTPPGTTDPRVR